MGSKHNTRKHRERLAELRKSQGLPPRHKRRKAPAEAEIPRGWTLPQGLVDAGTLPEAEKLVPAARAAQGKDGTVTDDNARTALRQAQMKATQARTLVAAAESAVLRAEGAQRDLQSGIARIEHAEAERHAAHTLALSRWASSKGTIKDRPLAEPPAARRPSGWPSCTLLLRQPRTRRTSLSRPGTRRRTILPPHSTQ